MYLWGPKLHRHRLSPHFTRSVKRTVVLISRMRGTFFKDLLARPWVQVAVHRYKHFVKHAKGIFGIHGLGIYEIP